MILLVNLKTNNKIVKNNIYRKMEVLWLPFLFNVLYNMNIKK